MNLHHLRLALSGFAMLCNAKPLTAIHALCGDAPPLYPCGLSAPHKTPHSIATQTFTTEFWPDLTETSMSTVDTRQTDDCDCNEHERPRTTITTTGHGHPVVHKTMPTITVTTTIDIWERGAADIAKRDATRIWTEPHVCTPDVNCVATTTIETTVYHPKTTVAVDISERDTFDIAKRDTTRTWTESHVCTPDVDCVATTTIETTVSHPMTTVTLQPELTGEKMVTVEIWERDVAQPAATQSPSTDSDVETPTVNRLSSPQIPLKSLARRGSSNPFLALKETISDTFIALFRRDRYNDTDEDMTWWEKLLCKGRGGPSCPLPSHREWPCPCSIKERTELAEAISGCSDNVACVDNRMPCPCDKNEKASPRCDPSYPCMNQRFGCPCEPEPEDVGKEWGWWVMNKCDWTEDCQTFPKTCTLEHPENCEPVDRMRKRNVTEPWD